MANIDRQIGIWAGWIAGPAFGLAMMAAPDYLHLSPAVSAVCFWGGIGVFIVTIAVVAILSAHEQERQHRVMGPIVMMVAGAAIFLGGAAWYFWPQTAISKSEQASATVSAAPIKPTTSVTEIELQTMRDVDNWVGVMDENSLRNIFDIQNILDRNLSYVSKNGQPYHGEPVEGRVPIFGRTPGVSLVRGPNNSGLAIVNPGTISLIFTTDVYESAKGKLDQYARSAYLDDTVRSSISIMSKRIEADLNLMIDVLDRGYKTDHNLLTRYRETPYIGAVSNTYFDSFLPLRPIAESISEAIRSRVRGAE
jgi:hypothetical protein